MEIKQTQFDKLPNWAKSELIRLRSDLASANKKLEQINGLQETNIYMLEVFDMRPLPASKTIRFVLSNNEWMEFRHNDSETLVVHASSGINVQPRASNSIHLKIID